MPQPPLHLPSRAEAFLQNLCNLPNLLVDGIAVVWDCGVTYRKTQELHLPNLKSPFEVGFVPSQHRGGHVSLLSEQCQRGSWQRKSTSGLSRRGGTRQVVSQTPPRGAQLHLNSFLAKANPGDTLSAFLLTLQFQSSVRSGVFFGIWLFLCLKLPWAVCPFSSLLAAEPRLFRLSKHKWDTAQA